MTSEELVDKVARIIDPKTCAAYEKAHAEKDVFVQVQARGGFERAQRTAVAAIHIVLDEAAKVADDAAEKCAVTLYASASQAVAANDVAIRIGSDIRALKPGGE